MTPEEIAKYILQLEAEAKKHREEGYWEMAATLQEEANNLRRGQVQTIDRIPSDAAAEVVNFRRKA